MRQTRITECRSLSTLPWKKSTVPSAPLRRRAAATGAAGGRGGGGGEGSGARGRPRAGTR